MSQAAKRPSTNREKVTAERLRELLDYDPETGVFRRRVRMANMAAGTIAGNINWAGYVRISVDNRSYRGHQLAWFWMTGQWPSDEIDHKDRDKSNNRWQNLRSATRSQNSANKGPQRNSSSGFKGVFFYKAYGRWTSQLWKDGQAHFIGYFDTVEQASEARSRKGRELFGEFWRDD